MPWPPAVTVAGGGEYPEEGKRGVVYLIARLVLRPLFLLAFRPHVRGRENVPASGPFIIASNHLSFIDSMAIPLMSPRRVGYLAKSEYFTTPGFRGWLTRRCSPPWVRCPWSGRPTARRRRPWTPR